MPEAKKTRTTLPGASGVEIQALDVVQQVSSPATVQTVAEKENMSEQKQQYVLGFMFSPHKERLALIRKAKPEWQRGKLNGIGGKIESESKNVAMVREFREETGLDTTGQQWEYFCRMEGKDFEVHCFATVGDIYACRTMEQERIETLLVAEIPHRQAELVENLPWLIHLAIDYLEDERPGFVVAAYDQPFPFGDSCPNCASLQTICEALRNDNRRLEHWQQEAESLQTQLEAARSNVSKLDTAFDALKAENSELRQRAEEAKK